LCYLDRVLVASKEYLMKRLIWLSALATVVLGGASTLIAVKVGEPAPAFTATDNTGKAHSLDSYKGKWIVLEWHNRDCPYVVKHYGSGNMQKLQKEWIAKGVVWLTIVSSGQGKAGYVTPEQSVAYVKEQNASPTAVLLDPSGEVGHLYDAKTTPHMFVVDPKGIVIYNGALDDKPTRDAADIATATNYVSGALTEAMAGKPVSVPTSRPYG
jgi:peroxiredoxin